ncbi:hypothetical protein [Pedobacter rhodius]|uniref:Uncharacterized protein n=1 Tax=Pedobacter rhodius TaxID=3004098 RepID=A0ABT4L343_9SPHI|nr:hypothetical protein [Pedobacter sp. SJ11]MCZ4224822.1 hypothetical protein [Pedobacter sp. SJ11]
MEKLLQSFCVLQIKNDMDNLNKISTNPATFIFDEENGEITYGHKAITDSDSKFGDTDFED